MLESSQFTDSQSPFESFQPLEVQGATCDTFLVKLYGKLHFLKRLKPAFSNDIRCQEAFRKEFETGYRLEHPNLVRYISSSDDGILMEYVDGETLTQRLSRRPSYFKKRKNTEKFVRQLLGAVGYLHAHQVLHLDLKPDNILFTRINNDVKLIDLGCCYTDSFPGTTGHTNYYAAPEQLTGGRVDVRTDIYAIGRILELLPCHHIYDNVIARCAATDKADRYQSVEDMVRALSNQWRPYLIVLIAALLIAVVSVALFLWHQAGALPETREKVKVAMDTLPTLAPQETDSQKPATIPVPAPVESLPQPQVSASIDTPQKMERELDDLIDAAYRSTVASFCDSVFPSITVGRQWEKQSSEFHAQVLQIAADVSKKHPGIPESVVFQHAESRFQSLVTYVFSKMRENGEKQGLEK